MALAIGFVLFFVALAIGNFHARQGEPDKPIWPVRIFIKSMASIGRVGRAGPVGEMVEKELTRKDISFTEQFMAATAVWFVILCFTSYGIAILL